MTTTSIEKRYILYSAFCKMWFVGAVWLLFYRLFMTDQRVGVLDAISFGIGLLVQIPAGVIADQFGRKKFVVLGIFMASIGMALQGLANGYATILCGQIILTVGWAFRSGADVALFYQALNYNPDSNSWKKLVSKGNQVGLIVTLLSYLVGSYLYTISPRLPFIAAILSMGAIAMIWSIPDSRNRRKGKDSATKEYIQSLINGIKQLEHKQLIGYLPLILVVEGLFYSFGYGLLRPILQTRFDFGASAGGWVLFICGSVAVVMQWLQYRFIDRFDEKISISAVAMMTGLALLLAVLPLGHLGFLVILVIYVGEYLINPLISNGINKHTKAEYRATTLSAAEFLKSLPYVIMAPLIGYLNVRGQLYMYLIVMAVLCMIALIIYLKKVNESPKQIA